MNKITVDKVTRVTAQLKKEGYPMKEESILLDQANGIIKRNDGNSSYVIDVRQDSDDMLSYLRKAMAPVKAEADKKKAEEAKKNNAVPGVKPKVPAPKTDTAKGKPAPANPELAKKTAEENADQQLIDANFINKSIIINRIFTEEDRKDAKLKAKIDKLRTFFINSEYYFGTSSNRMEIEDAAIVRRVDPATKVETKYIQLTLDNDGVNQDMYKNIQIPYDKVVKDGKLDYNAFNAALRRYFVIDVFPKI